MADTSLDETQQDFVLTIQESAEKPDGDLSTIFYDYNKIISGRIDLETIDFSIGIVLQNTMKLMQFKAEEKLIRLVCYAAPEINEKSFRGDPYRLSQILVKPYR